MKTLSRISAAALAMAFTAAPAMAQKFDPRPSTTTFSGTLTLSQSITLDCVATVGLTIDAAGQGTVTSRSFAPGAPQCGSVIVPFGTWDIDPGPTVNQVTVTAGSSSILGQCSGTVVVPYDNATGEIVFAGTSFPGTPVPCTVTGRLTSSPKVTIVP